MTPEEAEAAARAAIHAEARTFKMDAVGQLRMLEALNRYAAIVQARALANFLSAYPQFGHRVQFADALRIAIAAIEEAT